MWNRAPLDAPSIGEGAKFNVSFGALKVVFHDLCDRCHGIVGRGVETLIKKGAE